MNYTVFFSLQYLIPSRFWAVGEGSGKMTKASLLPVGFHLPYAHLHMYWRMVTGYQIIVVLSRLQQQQHWTQLTSLSLK